MNKPLSVAVLVSAGRHPVSGAPRACRGDAVALALGRKIAGEALRVIHAGDAGEPALQDYLAFGAGRIEVVPVSEGSDAVGVLTRHLQATDLILTGTRTERGAGSGLLPYLLATSLGRPVIGGVLDAALENKEVAIRQFLPKGKRRRLAAQLPAVLAVHPLAPAELCYAHVRRLSGRIEPLSDATAATASQGGAWAVESGARRPVPLRGPENSDGYARMLTYVQSPAKGGAVAFDGSPVDKAQILLSYLREHRLVDF